MPYGTLPVTGRREGSYDVGKRYSWQRTRDCSQDMALPLRVAVREATHTEVNAAGLG